MHSNPSSSSFSLPLISSTDRNGYDDPMCIPLHPMMQWIVSDVLRAMVEMEGMDEGYGGGSIL